jgi:cell division septum initiation protein DivIVA
MSEQGEFRSENWGFNVELRGYNRQQVDEHVAKQAWSIRELESKLSQGLAEVEKLRAELAQAQERIGRPRHEEVSENVKQILKLAAEEAKAERERGGSEAAQLRDAAKHDTDKLRSDTKRDTDQIRAHAQDQAERMLAAAAEQSERSVTAAKAEADHLVSTAQAAADQAVEDATKHAETTVASAIAQAKQQLDEATARATAIHDGAERRLNLLISRHTETVRRLTEVRDVVTNLLAGESSRGSLEDEVNRAMGAQAGTAGTDGRQGASGSHESAAAGAHRAGSRPAAAIDGRRAGASAVTAVPTGASQPAGSAQPAGRTGAYARPRETPEDLADQHDELPAQDHAEPDSRETPADAPRPAAGLAGAATRSATRTMGEHSPGRRGSDD